jgi:hypothetical protein
MKSAEKPDGWEQHRRDQLRRWMSATPAQRLAALEEMIVFARKYAGIARREPGRGPGETAAS